MDMRINMPDHFIGIDLGGTNIKIGIFDENVKLLNSISVPTNAQEYPEIIIDRMAQMSRQICAENDIEFTSLKAIGVGAPGPSNIAEGIVVAAPNLPKFHNVPIKQMMQDRTGKICVFENDANAACYGEYVVGAGRGADNMVFITLGTGIGGGIITNGQIVHGFMDNAAELGHMIIEMDGRLCGCGQQGCVEAYASAKSTVKRTIEALQAGRQSSLMEILKQKGTITAKDIYTESAKDDALALEITEGTAKALGILCVSLLHVTGPRRILFAGGMIAAGDALLGRIRHFYNKYLWPLKPEKMEIRFATLGESAGMIGAAALACEFGKN